MTKQEIQKFKVGDRVRIVKDYMGGADPHHRIGKLATIHRLTGDAIYPFFVRIEGELEGAVVNEVELVKRKYPVIVITTDGKTTTATMRKGKNVIKTASAKCSDNDTFDIAEGARVAFERLQGRDPFPKKEEEKRPDPPKTPKKVICVKSNGKEFVAGKIYELRLTIAIPGITTPFRVGSFGVLKTPFGYEVNLPNKSEFWACFIPLVED